jgi:hypothetical protein
MRWRPILAVILSERSEGPAVRIFCRKGGNLCVPKGRIGYSSLASEPRRGFGRSPKQGNRIRTDLRRSRAPAPSARAVLQSQYPESTTIEKGT